MLQKGDECHSMRHPFTSHHMTHPWVIELHNMVNAANTTANYICGYNFPGACNAFVYSVVYNRRNLPT